MPGRSRFLSHARHALVALAMALGSCSSDGRLAIVVQVDGLPPQTSSLAVSASLDGKLAGNPTMQITENLNQFVVYLPETTQGALTLDISAVVPGSSCATARAKVPTQVHPAPPHVLAVSASLQPQSPALCPLTVNLTGDGAVQDGSHEMACNHSQCRGLYPQGAQVTLSGVPGARSADQVTWSAATCTTPGSSCSVTVSGPVSINASFTTLPCSPTGWCQHNARVNGANLRGIWSGGPNNVWVVGTNSTVVHYDGSAWTAVPAVPNSNYTFYSVASTGPSDVVIGGDVMGTTVLGVLVAYDGSQWREVAHPGKLVRTVRLDSPTSGRATGDGRMLYYRSGAAWMGVDQGSMGAIYWSVYNTGSVEYVSGTAGLIGTATPGTTSITEMTLLVNGSPAGTLYSISGTGAKDLWAVGDYDGLWHYDGSSWNQSPQSGMPSTTGTLFSVYGSAPTDYWAVGDSQTLLHYNGTSWSVVSTGSSSLAYHAVGGSAQGDVWIVGDGGVILQRQP